MVGRQWRGLSDIPRTITAEAPVSCVRDSVDNHYTRRTLSSIVLLNVQGESRSNGCTFRACSTDVHKGTHKGTRARFVNELRLPQDFTLIFGKKMN